MIFGKRSQNKLQRLLNGRRYTGGTYHDENGFKIEYPDEVSFAWTYLELFNKKTYYFANNNNNPFIIDCGANIGISVLYFKTLFPHCKIIAFEPNPFLFSYLEKNVHDNKIVDVDLRREALWDNKSEYEFFEEQSDSARLINIDKNLKGPSKIISVKTALLSQHVTGQVDYLKMDIEGAEFFVLRELGDKLNHIKRLFVESHSFCDKEQDLHKILVLLSSYGFRYYLSEGAVVTSNPFLKLKSFQNMDLQINIHAFKPT